MRIRKIGTVTFGCMLILFGTLFLIHMFVPQLSYEWIFRLWPVILIGLGIEILSAKVEKEEKHVYDGAAVFLLVFLTLFAMGMAVADLAIKELASGKYFVF